MRIPLMIRAFAVIALLGNSLGAAEPLSLGSLFTDHAVLQRDMAVPVWGKAEPGLTVMVRFAEQEKSVTADNRGMWMVKLDPLAASAERRDMTVRSVPGSTPSVPRPTHRSIPCSF